MLISVPILIIIVIVVYYTGKQSAKATEHEKLQNSPMYKKAVQEISDYFLFQEQHYDDLIALHELERQKISSPDKTRIEKQITELRIDLENRRKGYYAIHPRHPIPTDLIEYKDWPQNIKDWYEIVGEKRRKAE